jgi:hypothetical protein
MKNLLPIGSVVLLNDSEKRVMIFGRLVKHKQKNETWDYVGCPYPEGNLGPDKNFLFNHNQIKILFSIGFQDNEEFELREKLNSEE